MAPQLSQAAINKLSEIARHGYVRVQVQTGGHSGLSYRVVQETVLHPGDTQYNFGNFTLVIDRYSLPYLEAGLASIPEASILYRYTSVLVSVSVSANSIDTLVHILY